MSIRNYGQAEEHLAQGRSKERRPLEGRATSLERRAPDAIAVKYQATDVVTFRADGTAELDSGGWRTATTKERMNTYSMINVWQRAGIWYVPPPGARMPEHPDTLFFDGIKIDDSGRVLNPLHAHATQRLEEAKKKVDRMVSKYIADFVAHLREVGHVEQPDAGDCWHCMMRTVEGGRPLGDATGNVGHLLSHFKEAYCVPSLLVNAIEERGYGGGVGMVVAMANGDLQRGLDGRYALGTVKDSLRGYFRRRKLQMAEKIACI